MLRRHDGRWPDGRCQSFKITLQGGQPLRHWRGGTDSYPGRCDGAISGPLDKRCHHDDRNDQISARSKLDEGRVAARFRQDDGGQNLAGLARRTAVPNDELRERQPANICCGGQFDRSVQCQQRWDAVGGGRSIAQVSGDCAPILDLDGANLPGRQLQCREALWQWYPENIRPRGATADPYMTAAVLYAADASDAGERNHIAWQGPSGMGRIDVGSSTQYRRIACCEQRQGFFQRAGLCKHRFPFPANTRGPTVPGKIVARRLLGVKDEPALRQGNP